MTVKDLIARLSNMDLNTQVVRMVSDQRYVPMSVAIGTMAEARPDGTLKEWHENWGLETPENIIKKVVVIA